MAQAHPAGPQDQNLPQEPSSPPVEEEVLEVLVAQRPPEVAQAVWWARWVVL